MQICAVKEHKISLSGIGNVSVCKIGSEDVISSFEIKTVVWTHTGSQQGCSQALERMTLKQDKTAL